MRFMLLFRHAYVSAALQQQLVLDIMLTLLLLLLMLMLRPLMLVLLQLLQVPSLYRCSHLFILMP